MIVNVPGLFMIDFNQSKPPVYNKSLDALQILMNYLEPATWDKVPRDIRKFILEAITEDFKKNQHK